ncbi:MAG: tetratricopeptide repeat protein [Myxococcales bacterium]|nr:tetratricopeptide repeat protein [Myxococcales bacterium]
MRPLGRRELAFAALLVAALAFVGALTGLSDYDTLHLLAAGRDIVRRGGFPAEDPFLFPMKGLPAGPPASWLTSVLLYLSYALAGEPGPVLLAALLSAGLFALLLADSLGEERSWSGLAVSLAVLALAFAVYRPRAVPRPELFAWLFLAVTLFALRRFEAGKGRGLYFFPAAALFWGSLHQSLAVGIGALAVWVAVGLGQAAVERLTYGRVGGAPPLGQLGAVAAVGAGGLVAGLLVPTSGLSTATALMSSQLGAAGAWGSSDSGLALMRHLIVELRPLSKEDWLGPFGALVALSGISFLAGWRRTSPRDLVLLLAFVVAAAPTRRFAPMAALVAAPIAARNFAVGLRRVRPHLASIIRVAACAVGALVFVSGAWAAAAAAVPFGTSLAKERFPARAASYLEAIGFSGRLYNTFQYGGYLEWVLDRPVFQDGRGALRAQDAAAALFDTSHYERFAPLDQRYRFDALVLARPNLEPSVAASLERVGVGRDWAAPREIWSLVAFDDGGLLYLRRGGAYAERAERDEYRFALPANPFPFEKLSDRQYAHGLLADLSRSVAESPRCRLCRLYLGLSLIDAGRPAEAEAALLPALGPPEESELPVLMALAQAAEHQGDAEKARRWYRRALGRAEGERLWVRQAWARFELSLAGRSHGGQAARPAPEEQARRRAEELFRAGLALASAGKAEEAIASYRASLEAFEASAPAHSNLGYLYLERGEAEAAAREQKRALEISPEHPEAHFGLGMALEKLGDVEGARQAFRAYLRLVPRGYWSLQAEQHLENL